MHVWAAWARLTAEVCWPVSGAGQSRPECMAGLYRLEKVDGMGEPLYFECAYDDGRLGKMDNLLESVLVEGSENQTKNSPTKENRLQISPSTSLKSSGPGNNISNYADQLGQTMPQPNPDGWQLNQKKWEQFSLYLLRLSLYLTLSVVVSDKRVQSKQGVY